MNLNISIIEDEKIFAEQLKSFLEKWSKNNKTDVSINIYLNGEDYIKSNLYSDELIFLDIDLITMNGMSLAKQLRKNGFTGYIIFITALTEYVFEGYHVQALDYLLKPVDYDKLVACMKPVLKNIKQSQHIYETKKEIVKIPYNRILAFTSYRHYVDIIIYPSSEKEKNNYRQKITIKSLEKQLPKEFVRCHRTIIININKVIKLTNRDVTLIDNSTYPISESYLKSVRKAFSEQINV